MSFHILSNSGKLAYGVKEFIIDTYDDINAINVKSITPGSTVFVIDASEYYMLNTKLEWKKVNIANGATAPGQGGGSTPEEIEVIYDGGGLDAE